MRLAAEHRARASVGARAGFAVALLVGAAARLSQACPLPAAQPGEGPRLEAGGIQVAWLAEPERLAVGRPFALKLQVCPASAQVLRVDATMPEHRHGMNYRPSVKPVGERAQGQWRAEGLLWHMAGRWELAIEVEDGGQRAWLRQSIVLQ